MRRRDLIAMLGDAAAPRVGVEAVAGGVHDADEIERAISAFAATPDGGVISLPHAITEVHHALIISLERRFRLPSVHAPAEHAREGTLIAYGPDYAESFRHAANTSIACATCLSRLARLAPQF